MFCQDLTQPLQIKKVTAQSCPWPKHLLNISVEDNLTEFLILRARGLPREANYDIISLLHIITPSIVRKYKILRFLFRKSKKWMKQKIFPMKNWVRDGDL